MMTKNMTKNMTKHMTKKYDQKYDQENGWKVTLDGSDFNKSGYIVDYHSEELFEGMFSRAVESTTFWSRAGLWIL